MWHLRDYVKWLTCLQFSICLCSGPPEKPSNLSCITYYDKNMTCWWNPGKDKHITTTYQLKLFIPSIPLQSCIPENFKNSCTIFYPDFHYYVDYIIWVEAKNNFGKTDSDHLVMDTMNSVKPEPIFITSVQPGHGLSRSLIVRWKKPLKLPKVFPLKYCLRYRMAGTADWIEVELNETSSQAEFFMIEGLKPFTKYIVAIRCMKQDGKGYWSDWSLEKTGTTSEDQPSQGPDLWIVNKNPSSQNRSILIMWKEPSKSEANGVIKGYQLKIKERKSQAVMCINSTNLEYSLILSGESYTIAITAYNSVGNSPASVLIVPSANQKELPPVLHVSAAPHNDQLMVEWKASSSTVNTYVVEWCVVESDSNECSGPVHWMYEPNTTNKAFVK
ncbi:interleukin-6 receptor subunit beta-like, partial [Rhincodon typus]|uniref:interleukin-6 receptor subunit beta-like n=1 Tax=Rhincodon typus TaxID=259920 RepID=UPI00202E8426